MRNCRLQEHRPQSPTAETFTFRQGTLSTTFANEKLAKLEWEFWSFYA
jgi:hypothetical protein